MEMRAIGNDNGNGGGQKQQQQKQKETSYLVKDTCLFQTAVGATMYRVVESQQPSAILQSHLRVMGSIVDVVLVLVVVARFSLVWVSGKL